MLPRLTGLDLAATAVQTFLPAAQAWRPCTSGSWRVVWAGPVFCLYPKSLVCPGPESAADVGQGCICSSRHTG